jgi:hypothetical protein
LRWANRSSTAELDGEIVVYEKNSDSAALALRAAFDAEQLIDYALIGSEANRVAKEPGHRAEVTAIGTTSAGFHGNNIKAFP